MPEAEPSDNHAARAHSYTQHWHQHRFLNATLHQQSLQDDQLAFVIGSEPVLAVSSGPPLCPSPLEPDFALRLHVLRGRHDGSSLPTSDANWYHNQRSSQDVEAPGPRGNHLQSTELPLGAYTTLRDGQARTDEKEAAVHRIDNGYAVQGDRTWSSPDQAAHDGHQTEGDVLASTLGMAKQSRDMIERSKSSPSCAEEVLSKIKHKICSYPKRSFSVSQATHENSRESTTAQHKGAALDSVSLYYATTAKGMMMHLDGQGVAQLTNSQRIRRCASFQAHMTTFRSHSVRSMKSIRSYTVKHVDSLLKVVPFPSLLRSGSFETSGFYHSVQLLHDARETAKQRSRIGLRFRNGKITASGRSTLMPTAYPSLKCGYCPRVFKGSERKRKYVRHCKNVHKLKSHELESQDPRQSDARESITPFVPSPHVFSVDDMLLPNWNIGATDESSQQVNTTDNSNDSDIADWIDIDPAPVSSPLQTSGHERYHSRTWWGTLPTSATSQSEPEPGSDDLLWNRNYMPWASDRVVHSGAPLSRIDENTKWTPSVQNMYETEVCTDCGAKFSGKYAKGNRLRHIRAKHSGNQLSLISCRACGKQYRRADARRKHEWKQHRLYDSKPNKRRAQV